MDVTVSLPDSTTFLASPKQELQEAEEEADNMLSVSADTAMETFPDLFLGGDHQTILGDFLTSGGDSCDKSRKDILASALMSIEDTKYSPSSCSDNSADLVSSTIHGFPQENEQHHNPPVIVLSQQSASSYFSPNDVYTLTLTDGSIVQLRVQQQQQNCDVLTTGDRLFNMLRCPSSSPPPVAEEVTLDHSSSPPTSPVGTVVSHDSLSSYGEDESSSSGFDDDALLSMFSSMDSVTIEALKAHLTSLPEGQTDLGALLVAAKVDLSVDDIVGPPLTQVKRLMEQKGLSDWQVQLCIKIRRRKKNTAAVRSSRRKRNQYVSSLRQEVTELRQRRAEAKSTNELLKLLHALWVKTMTEVEAEIQEGVRKQLGLETSSAGPPLGMLGVTIPSNGPSIELPLDMEQLPGLSILPDLPGPSGLSGLSGLSELPILPGPSKLDKAVRARTTRSSNLLLQTTTTKKVVEERRRTRARGVRNS